MFMKEPLDVESTPHSRRAAARGQRTLAKRGEVNNKQWDVRFVAARHLMALKFFPTTARHRAFL
jgi:hypothetical protein